jgi:hypothetical protein
VSAPLLRTFYPLLGVICAVMHRTAPGLIASVCTFLGPLEPSHNPIENATSDKRDEAKRNGEEPI